MAEVSAPGPKKLPAESHAREAGLAAAEATSELLESGGYSFRHFDLGLIWPAGQGLGRAPLAVAAVAPVCVAVVAQVMPATELGFRMLMASNLVLPFLLGVVGALVLVRIRDRLVGAPEVAFRERWTLLATTLGLQLVFFPVTAAVHAAAFSLVGVRMAMVINMASSLVVQWVWTHVLARLALLGEGAFRSLALGIADSLIYALRALVELPRYPLLWWSRLQGEEDRSLSAVDLVASQLIMRGLAAVGGSVVTLVSLLFALDFAAAGGGVGISLYLAGQAFVGALALQLGLGRWAFYRLALATEVGPDSVEAAATLPPTGIEATT